ncbi:MAG TPA: CoB--CoM heterodisulfide reductase iron-sulfur subunit B family protein [Desulfotignum sp.]|nr:CoB--CoM heterodisulfide reductase iron-sulfur subunit B family protein [Desulfotignum sp.]
MAYLYYPGCSLEGTAMEYDLSTRALFAALGITLTPITDWTCCGATAAHAMDALLAHVLPARNLALAEKMDQPLDILVPCSACYLNLKTARQAVQTDPDLLGRVNQVLSEEDLEVTGSLTVRHLLDVLSRDVDMADIARAADNRMAGLTVAPYYGCQCLRPFPEFDDPEQPRSMEAMIKATGAGVLKWDMGGACCGASGPATNPDTGRVLVGRIMEQATNAQAIVTVCPMCQMNLERFQPFPIPVLYLPQFLGLAMGLSPASVGCGLNLSDISPFLDRAAP